MKVFSNNDDDDLYKEVDKLRKLISSLENCYQATHDSQDSLNTLVLYVYFIWRLAISLRNDVGVDLCALTFPVEPPPLEASHPLTRALPVLDRVIENQLDRAESSSQDKTAYLYIYCQMQAGFVWKAYLLALNTHPLFWENDAAFAMGTLAILAKVDREPILKMFSEDNDPMIRQRVRQEDWPPSGFMRFYKKYREIIERKLSSAIQSPIEGDNMEIAKLIGRQNTMRRTQGLDRSPRLTVSELAARVARTQGIGSLMKIHSEVRREDFCDIVAAVVKNGSINANDKPMALQLREWVQSDGDRQKPFPDWLAEEGGARMLSLNKEWLASGDHRISFDDWLARIDSRSMQL